VQKSFTHIVLIQQQVTFDGKSEKRNLHLVTKGTSRFQTYVLFTPSFFNFERESGIDAVKLSIKDYVIEL
jgi:hypothetical protein